MAANAWVRGWGTTLRGQSAFGTPEDFYWFTLHGSLDHLRHGITSIYNFTGGGQPGSPTAPAESLAFQEQQLLGGIDSGARVMHAWSRPRTIGEAEQRKLLTDFLAFAEPYKKSPLFLGFSISGSAMPAEAVALDAALGKEYGFVNETHYLEYPVDVPSQQALFDNFVKAGALGPSLFFGHFIHTNDAMLEAVGKAGGGMSWQPLSNGRLASGIADIPKYLKYGIKVGMGVDGQASADLPDPFENMRVGLYFIRAKYENGNVLKPIDVLRLHTMGSATVMRIDDKVGSLKPGKRADLIMVNTKAPNLGVFGHPAIMMVTAAQPSNVEMVMVDGRILKKGGKLTHLNADRIVQEAHDANAALRKRAKWW